MISASAAKLLHEARTEPRIKLCKVRYQSVRTCNVYLLQHISRIPETNIKPNMSNENDHDPKVTVKSHISAPIRLAAT
jgi:hypothetical protein